MQKTKKELTHSAEKNREAEFSVRKAMFDFKDSSVSSIGRKEFSRNEISTKGSQLKASMKDCKAIIEKGLEIFNPDLSLHDPKESRQPRLVKTPNSSTRHNKVQIPVAMPVIKPELVRPIRPERAVIKLRGDSTSPFNSVDNLKKESEEHISVPIHDAEKENTNVLNIRYHSELGNYGESEYDLINKKQVKFKNGRGAIL